MTTHASNEIVIDSSNDVRWYFAFGANMAASVFLERRKIKPLRTEVAYVPTHTLCFNVPGIPYADPGNGGLRELPSQDEKNAVYGVAYLLTQEDLKRVVLSEGGGIAYYVAKLDARLQAPGGAVIQVNTLMGRHNVSAANERLPSQRYIVGANVIDTGVLLRGAKEHQLPEWYQLKLAQQPTFQPLPSVRWRLGMSLFLWPWIRMAIGVERLVHRYQGPDGHVPKWFLFIFDSLLWLMWAQHDYLFGPVFGRGDGR